MLVTFNELAERELNEAAQYYELEQPGLGVASFQELLSSVRQVGKIRRGTTHPSRVTTFDPTDVQAIRATLLRVAARNPKAVIEALHTARKRGGT